MISTRGRYAIRLMIDLAEHENGGYIPLKDIAVRQGISKKYLEIIVKDMVAGGLLVGASGKGGGYRLLRHPEEYPVGEILERMEGSLAAVACLAEDAAPCARAGECLTLPLWTEYDRLMTVEERKEQLEEDCKKALSAYAEKAGQLSEVRREAADLLRKELVAQMADLGMPHAAFEARISRLPGDAPSAKGYDSVEFMFSANRGEPVKPLAHIASGGEISRIMLAFKTATAGSDGIPTMVFDEIDTGVSGDISTALARKMREIAEQRQVLCVTHLAQIAAYAHTNYYVEKKTDGDRTVSVAVRLDDSQRAREIARIMSGSSDDPAALQHAENLIRSAKNSERKYKA